MLKLLAIIAILSSITFADPPEWGSWNTGEFQLHDGQDTGYHPDWQYEQVTSGKHISPTFEFMSHNFASNIREAKPHYYEPMWSHARENKLPLVLIGRNFEDLFRTMSPWKDMGADDNLHVVLADGTVKTRWVSPWNKNSHHWYDLGLRMGQYLQREYADDYPDPPHVYIGNNNEMGIPRLVDAMKDVAMPDYLVLAEKQLIHREMWEGIRLRRGHFLRGLRDGCPSWANVLHVYAYTGFGNSFGEVDIRSDPHRYRLPWAGADGRIEFAGLNVTANIGYLHNWSTHSPHKVRSPQVEAGNARYALDRYRDSVNPAFDLETHFWNGRSVGPEVFRGVVRCVLWQMRTKRNRLFLGASATRAETMERHMQPFMESVEEIHDNPILLDFWEHGTLLPNLWTRDWEQNPARNRYDTQSGYGHPYFWPAVMPPEEQDPGQRWFLQRVPLNERFVPWNTIGGRDDRMWDRWVNDRSHQVDVPVFAICLEKDGQYLLFAHAPMGRRDGVEIQVCPDGNVPRFSVIVGVTTGGGFWLCDGHGSVVPVLEVATP